MAEPGADGDEAAEEGADPAEFLGTGDGVDDDVALSLKAHEDGPDALDLAALEAAVLAHWAPGEAAAPLPLAPRPPERPGKRPGPLAEGGAPSAPPPKRAAAGAAAAGVGGAGLAPRPPAAPPPHHLLTGDSPSGPSAGAARGRGKGGAAGKGLASSPGDGPGHGAPAGPRPGRGRGALAAPVPRRPHAAAAFNGAAAKGGCGRGPGQGQGPLGVSMLLPIVEAKLREMRERCKAQLRQEALEALAECPPEEAVSLIGALTKKLSTMAASGQTSDATQMTLHALKNKRAKASGSTKAPSSRPPAEKPLVAEASAAKTPVPKASVPKASVAKTPVPKVPVSKVPAVKTPVAKVPVSKAPAAKTPVAKVPVVKVSIAKVPVATSKDAVAKVPVAKAPVAKVGVKVAVAKVAVKVAVAKVAVKVAVAKAPVAKVAAKAAVAKESQSGRPPRPRAGLDFDQMAVQGKLQALNSQGPWKAPHPLDEAVLAALLRIDPARALEILDEAEEQGESLADPSAFALQAASREEQIANPEGDE